MASPASSPLLILLVAWPLLGALLAPVLGRHSTRLRDGFALVVVAATLAGTAWLVALVRLHGRVAAELPGLLGQLEFGADPIGALFALFAAFVWFCATLYSLDYLRAGRGASRYHAASLVTLAAQLGVVLAGNLVTLFVFFEALGLVAFLLVVHAGSREAKRAGIQYFWMTLLGGVALLAGIMLIHAHGGGSLAPTAWWEGSPAIRVAAAALLVVGFGVKAGMVPLHIWLPNAHPVAPTPASALLSGVMIKAGAYGIFRSLSALFRPLPGAELASPTWQFSSTFGLTVLWFGIVTMAVGVVLALGQSNAKRMLAYHSISQMGFILAGLGVGTYLAGEGAMGTAGGLLHAVNHALFKACLFLGVGAVAFRTGQLDMYRLGGLWRHMPVTFGIMLVAAAGITGLPLVNGFVSRCLIHHALEAAASAGEARALALAERVYVLVCAGTAASFIKLIGLVFLAPAKAPRPAGIREAPVGMLIAMGLLAVPVVILGLRPHLALEGLLAPGLGLWAMPDDGIRHYLDSDFLSARDVRMGLMALGLGALIFAIGMKSGLFHLHLPSSVGAEYWYGRTSRGLLGGFRRTAGGYGRLQHRFVWLLRSGRRRFLVFMREAGLMRRRLAETLLAGLPGSPEHAFIDAAWVALERERRATVRAASAEAVARFRHPAGGAGREPLAESARAIAGLLAGRLFEARLEMLLEAGRMGGADAMRGVLAAQHTRFPATRNSIVAACTALAEVRLAGEDIVARIQQEIAPVLAGEQAALGTVAAVPAGRAAAAAKRGESLGGLLAWAVAVLRLVLAEFLQRESALPRSEALDTNPTVVATRRSIQRFARDVGLNVAAIFLVLALFAAALMCG
jgi:formate hydrogenlyase subunit 3/multisubunit Na+/H+ antiporter MnhD subunit